MLLYILFVILMGTLGRMSGTGFGQKWGIAWLPEALFAIPFGVAFGWAVGNPFLSIPAAFVSYLGMQSATWYFLRWESHDDPNTKRGGTLKPIVDWLAARCGWKLGDEGYAWVGAAVKGFIIGLPVGGVLTAILWPLGYEIGSHMKGHTERFGIEPQAVSEFLSAAFSGVSILVFIEIIKGI